MYSNRHIIIKYVGFKSIHCVINLNVVSSYFELIKLFSFKKNLKKKSLYDNKKIFSKPRPKAFTNEKILCSR